MDGDKTGGNYHAVDDVEYASIVEFFLSYGKGRNTSVEPKASKMANNTIGYGLRRHAEGGKKMNYCKPELTVFGSLQVEITHRYIGFR